MDDDLSQASAGPAQASAGPAQATYRTPGLRGLPLRFVVPNVVTLLALCAGLTAIRFAIENKFESAVLAILAAAVLDGIDGRIARALKGSSRFGAELDSLADFMDFGVAPGLLLYLWSLHQLKTVGWVAVLFFAALLALAVYVGSAAPLGLLMADHVYVRLASPPWM